VPKTRAIKRLGGGGKEVQSAATTTETITALVERWRRTFSHLRQCRNCGK